MLEIKIISRERILESVASISSEILAIEMLEMGRDYYFYYDLSKYASLKSTWKFGQDGETFICAFWL